MISYSCFFLCVLICLLNDCLVANYVAWQDGIHAIGRRAWVAATGFPNFAFFVAWIAFSLWIASLSLVAIVQ